MNKLPICLECGYRGYPEVAFACPKCFEDMLCPNECGEMNKPEGFHYYHDGPCTWHDGPCEEPEWCMCDYRKEQ